MTEELANALSDVNLFDLADLEGLPTYWREGATLMHRIFRTHSKKQPRRRTFEERTAVSSTTFIQYDFNTRRHCIPTGRILADWAWITYGVYAKRFAFLQALDNNLAVFQLRGGHDPLCFVYDHLFDQSVFRGHQKLLVEFYDLTSKPWLLPQQPPEFIRRWECASPIKPDQLEVAFHHYGDRAHSHLRVGGPGLEFVDSEPVLPDGIRTLDEEFTIWPETPYQPYVPKETPSPAALTAADYDVRGGWTETDPASLIYDIRQLALS